MGNVIVTAPRNALLSLDYVDDLATWMKRTPGSRRQIVEECTQILYDHHEGGGTIITPEDGEIDVYPGVLDDAHGEDGSGVWISEMRRRDKAARKPAPRMIDRLRLYSAIGLIVGRPVGNAARRREVAKVRTLLRSFNPIWRARYRHEMAKLRRSHGNALFYGAAVRRLRVRLAQELAAWQVAL